ncbi:GatB/YqeY domain-containing protein [Bartonella tamiae]|uniref:GatB/YqeY domain-containing protein n=1 Tax=Bartonella tamiae Th239 TaxID=1094558 RepID=J1JVZ1_9HYPH|nr:GatB/YqeY domain-containing protein [Bartonella tamiae]EJF89157.1 hypothetical protein ME5_01708 [Bartonella tamiae Th239]EJF95440.1 hypothetical protein MEG_00173 [Bartonella tamiae Th307]
MLREQIENALKTAMKAQNKERLATLRLINAAFKDRDIANRGEGKPVADETALQAILARMIKQREESARLYDEGGRAELAKAERDEIAIIQDYLPPQLSDEDMQQAIEDAISQTYAEGLRDMGKVMAWLKERFTGQMDFAKASGFIRSKLQSLT